VHGRSCVLCWTRWGSPTAAARRSRRTAAGFACRRSTWSGRSRRSGLRGRCSRSRPATAPPARLTGVHGSSRWVTPEIVISP
jgi:hypothetical protein